LITTTINRIDGISGWKTYLFIKRLDFTAIFHWTFCIRFCFISCRNLKNWVIRTAKFCNLLFPLYLGDIKISMNKSCCTVCFERVRDIRFILMNKHFRICFWITCLIPWQGFWECPDLTESVSLESILRIYLITSVSFLLVRKYFFMQMSIFQWEVLIALEIVGETLKNSAGLKFFLYPMYILCNRLCKLFFWASFLSFV